VAPVAPFVPQFWSSQSLSPSQPLPQPLPQPLVQSRFTFRPATVTIEYGVMWFTPSMYRGSPDSARAVPAASATPAATIAKVSLKFITAPEQFPASPADMRSFAR
jgi:hypothetical protein